MDYSVEEIQPNVWRLKIASITRIIRYRADGRTDAVERCVSRVGLPLDTSAYRLPSGAAVRSSALGARRD